jgi:putative membrane protein
MKLGLGLAVLAGLGLATGLIVHQGAAEVFGTLAALGWGIVALVLVHLVQTACAALGWRPLIGKPWPRQFLTLFKIRWIREGTNGLLPVAHIGGEIIGARLLSFNGVRGDVAGASVVVDLTVEVVTQILFTLLGLALLLFTGRGGETIGDVAMGVVAAVLVVGGFVIAQRVGLFKLVEGALDRVMKRARWLSFTGIKGLHDAIRAVHRRPGALAAAAGWHFLSWLLGGLEVWVALHFMGIDIDLREALILESLGQAVRSAGFAVPGALGVQEGGFMLFGAMLGIAPEAALALSLAKRLRELLLGLPALGFWQYVEGRRMFEGQRRASPRAEN